MNCQIGNMESKSNWTLMIGSVCIFLIIFLMRELGTTNNSSSNSTCVQVHRKKKERREMFYEENKRSAQRIKQQNCHVVKESKTIVIECYSH